MKRPPNKWMVLVAAAVLLSGGYGWWKASSGGAGDAARRKIVCYQDSMHPWVKLDRPGKCTICAMDLTPIYEGEKGFAAEGNVVMLSSNNVSVLNVQSEEIQRQPLTHILQVAGTLEGNEARKTYVASPTPGRVQALAVEFAGMEVEKGQALITLYSPELVQKRAYLFSLRSDPSTVGNGLMHTTMNNDPYSGELLAPQSGVVTERNVYNGQYVEEGQKLLTIVDASVVWFRFDLYERDLPWIQPGQTIQVTVSAVPGKVFPAVVSFIEPMLNEATRTVKVRADIENPVVSTNGHPQRLLRFGMYAQGRLKAALPNIITVPRTAILFPGSAAYAYVEKGDGAYERRRVRVGRQGGDRWEILRGLEEGDRVVTSGNVLIDAQAQFSQGTDAVGSEPDELADDESAEPQVQAEMVMSPAVKPAAAVAASLPSPALTPAAREALGKFLTVADGISQALAADNLSQLKVWLDQLPRVSATLSQESGKQHPWHPLLERIASASTWPPPKDLGAARNSFLPFSTNVVGLVQLVRGQEEEFAALKVFYCPMAPKPGLWFQAKGPLRNPYYGAEMLTCGSEVKKPTSAVKAVPAMAQPSQMVQPSVAAVQQPKPAKTASTVNQTSAASTAKQVTSSAVASAPKHESAMPAMKTAPAVRSVTPSASHEDGTNQAAAIRAAREGHQTARTRGAASYGFMATRDELQRQRWEAIGESARSQMSSGGTSNVAYIPKVRAGNSDEVMGIPQLPGQLVVYSGIAVTPEMEKIRRPFFIRLRGGKVDESMTAEAEKPSSTSGEPPPGHETPESLALKPPQVANDFPPPPPMPAEEPPMAPHLAAVPPMSPAEEPPMTPPAIELKQAAPPADAPAPVAAAPVSGLSAFLTTATGISRALAADDLAQFNQQVAKLSGGLSSWQKELAGTPQGKAMLKRVESLTRAAPAKNLAEARTRFLPFSTALVDFAKQQRKQNPNSAGMKIFHCPMAPKPGLWVQSGGPLRNPFYGAEMLTCGEEVAE